MARMRTLKPEFWEDETVAMLSRDARLLFMATWNAADDEGLLRWNPALLKSTAFIYDDDIDVSMVSAMMAELVDNGLVFPYIGGKARQQFGMIVKFHKHQRPNRPQESKLPAPSLQSPQIAEVYAERDDWTCHICTEAIPHGAASGTDKRRWLSLDHVHPKSKGGSDHPSNVRAAHRMCNSGKKDRVEDHSEELSEHSSEPRTAVVVGVSSGDGDGEGDVAGAVANAPETTAQTLVAEWIDHCNRRPPGQVVGQVAKHIGTMLGEGIDPTHVRSGLALWHSKGLNPATLPSVVNEVMNSPGTRAHTKRTTDDKVRDGLELARRLATETPAQRELGA